MNDCCEAQGKRSLYFANCEAEIALLSYRHGYHAGNFADVLKHLVQIECLQHIVKKEKPFTYIDTHAGAGLYSLESEQALKLQEYRRGIGALYGSTLPQLARYLEVVKRFNQDSTLRYYPGSALIAEHFLRPQDSARLYELHSTDWRILNDHCQSAKRISVHHDDGLKNLPGLLPPPSRRALVLIDPSYEVKSDYEEVPKAVASAYRKFSTGIYAIWYPVVQRSWVQQLEQRLAKAGIKDILRFELGLMEDDHGRGMTSSGMIVINPPWTLFARMQELLPQLSNILAGAAGNYRCDILIPQ